MSECGHRHVRGIHGYASIKDMLNSDGMQRWHHLQFALARVSQKSVADWPDARLMGDSIFCLVPRGRAAWSVRFFEALWAGCVPVLLSDRAVQLCNHFSRVSFWVFFLQDHYQPSFDQLFDATQPLGQTSDVLQLATP